MWLIVGLAVAAGVWLWMREYHTPPPSDWPPTHDPKMVRHLRRDYPEDDPS